MNPNLFALLIAAAPPGEPAIHNDQRAMIQTLLARGLPADRIFSLHGQLDRSLLLAFLAAARRRMDDWAAGSLFVHISGHGYFVGETAETARPGLEFSDTGDTDDDYHLLWEDFFAALGLPFDLVSLRQGSVQATGSTNSLRTATSGVRLTLLPDL